MTKNPPPVVTVTLTREQYDLLLRTLHGARVGARYSAEMKKDATGRANGRAQADALTDLIHAARRGG